MSQEILNQDGGPFNIMDDCYIDGCQYVYDEWQELYFHGYEHYLVEGLDEFARTHKSHILQSFDMTAYNLRVKNKDVMNVYNTHVEVSTSQHNLTLRSQRKC